MSWSVFSHYMYQGFFSSVGGGSGGCFSLSLSFILPSSLPSCLSFSGFLASGSCSLMKPFCTTYIQMLLSVLKQPASLTMKCDQKESEYAFSSFTATPYAS